MNHLQVKKMVSLKPGHHEPGLYQDIGNLFSVVQLNEPDKLHNTSELFIYIQYSLCNPSDVAAFQRFWMKILNDLVSAYSPVLYHFNDHVSLVANDPLITRKHQ